jgi:Lon protease-like protein
MNTLSGISRYRIKRELTGFTPYLKAEVSWTGFERDLGNPEEDKGFDRDRFMDLLQRFFAAQELATDWKNLREAEEELLINSLSMLCPFEPEERQALLEAASLTERRETLVTLIEFALRGGTDDEMVN